jgi:hypothetical protein
MGKLQKTFFSFLIFTINDQTPIVLQDFKIIFNRMMALIHQPIKSNFVHLQCWVSWLEILQEAWANRIGETPNNVRENL